MGKKRAIKNTALILCVVLLLSLFCGCPLSTFEGDETTSTVDTTISRTNPSETTAPADEVIVDLKGYTWKLTLPWAKKLLPGKYKNERGDKLLAIYNEVEELYNVKIEIASAPDLYSILSQMMADENSADVIGVEPCNIIPLAASRLIYSVDEPALLAAGLNSEDKSRWTNDFSSLVTWDSKQWTMQIGSEYDIPGFGNLILYNSSIITSLGAHNMSNIVRTGKWTTEMYLDLARAALDFEGDGTVEFKSHIDSKVSAFISHGGRVVSEQNGMWKNEIGRSISYTAVDSLSKLLARDMLIKDTDSLEIAAFAQGRLAFFWTNSREVLENVRLRSFVRVGIAPIPTETGLGQIALLSDYRGYSIPVSNPDLVKSITVLNALAKRMKGDYVSAYLQDTGLGESSRVMLESIIAGRTFDPILLDGTMYSKVENVFSTELTEEDYDLDEIMQNLSGVLDILIEEKNEDIALASGKGSTR